MTTPHPKTELRVLTDMRWPADTGIGNYMRGALSGLPASFKLIDVDAQGAIGHPLSPLAISRALGKQRSENIPSLFWSAGFMPPLRSSLTTMVTVHDLMHLRFYSGRHAAYYNLVLKPLYRRCDAIICVSQTTRQDFLSWTKLAPEKVHVVYSAPSPAYQQVPLTSAKTHDYVLYAGNHKAHKNLPRMIEAYATSKLFQQNIHFLLTGPENNSLRTLAGRLGVSEYVRFVGHVSEQDMPSLFSGALCVASASLYEGFALPMVEGMACGTPVLASNVSAMPEIAGGAALLVDPLSTEEIATGMEQLSRDANLRSKLIDRGLERAKAFDWQVSSQKLWDIAGQVASVKS